jgi:hypothetical protein
MSRFQSLYAVPRVFGCSAEEPLFSYTVFFQSCIFLFLTKGWFAQEHLQGYCVLGNQYNLFGM